MRAGIAIKIKPTPNTTRKGVNAWGNSAGKNIAEMSELMPTTINIRPLYANHRFR
jgi:hypothetical protein